MTPGDKEILLKDLCARLPYGVKMNHIANEEHSPVTLIGIAKDMITLEGNGGYSTENVEEFKPYLFPVSSMTEEQKEEWRGIRWSKLPWDELDWLNKGQWDYKHFIEKGLAIDATNKNIY